MMNQIRWVDNNDWVIAIILFCLFAYAFMLLSLNRDASLKDFILQTMPESANILGNWIVVSVVLVLAFTVLVSQYIPFVPKMVSEYQFMGWELNRWGFTFSVVTFYFLSKSFFSYLFYMSIGQGKRWNKMMFVATKYFFIYSWILMVITIINYYFGVDFHLMLRYYWYFFAFAFVFKLFYYKFNKNEILPKEWYYKILYICTLQIIPFWVLWKMLYL
jgi:hypothetical protein